MVFVLVTLGTVFGIRMNDSGSKQVDSGLPQFTLEQLKAYDGSDLSKPIYLALDGSVYDVTPGKEFYQTGGAYHSLAGKDSSDLLHLVGGSIIKRKYKVVGIIKS